MKRFAWVFEVSTCSELLKNFDLFHRQHLASSSQNTSDIISACLWRPPSLLYYGSHRHVATSMMESLPPDIMTKKMLEFTTVATRVKVARCGKSLQQVVYEECSAL